MTRSSEEQELTVEVRSEALGEKQLVHQQQQQQKELQQKRQHDTTNEDELEQQQQQQVDNSKPKRNPFCSRCRNHGKSAQVKGHKRHCEFRNCGCEGCRLVECRQLVSAAQIKRRRYQKQDEECGRKIEISPPVLRHESSNDPATLIAKTLMSSASAKQLHSYTDAPQHPTRHHHLPEVISISNHLQQPHPILPLTHPHLSSEQQVLQSSTNQALAIANSTSSLHANNGHPHPLIHPPHHHHHHLHHHHPLHHTHQLHSTITSTNNRQQPSTTTSTIPIDSSSVANNLQQLHSVTCNSSSSATSSHLKLNHHSPHQTSQASVSNSPVSSALNNAAFHLFHFPTSMLSAAAAASLGSGSSQTSSSLASLNPVTTTKTAAAATTTTTNTLHYGQTPLIIAPAASTSPSSPSFREQINLVKEVQDTYGPLAIYAWLKKENFDLHKVRSIIELSRVPFYELLQITGYSPLDLTNPNDN